MRPVPQRAACRARQPLSRHAPRLVAPCTACAVRACHFVVARWPFSLGFFNPLSRTTQRAVCVPAIFVWQSNGITSHRTACAVNALDLHARKARRAHKTRQARGRHANAHAWSSPARGTRTLTPRRPRTPRTLGPPCAPRTHARILGIPKTRVLIERGAEN